MGDDPVIALAGPTACGKSRLAAMLAEKIGGEIISVDSGAIYRRLDIGTAKPPPAMRQKIRHHLLDIRAADEVLGAGEFVRLALAAVAQIRARGRVPILAGGAMMYFRALREGLHEMPPVPAAIRRQMREELRRLGTAAMHDKLQKADFRSAQRIHRGDGQRICRALEVFYAAGKPLSEWTDQEAARLPMRAALLIPQCRKILRERIGARVQTMLASGWISETREAVRQYGDGAAAMKMIGYRQIAVYLRGELDERTMREKIFIATCQLARRQMTWLRAWDNPFCGIDPLEETAAEKMLAVFTPPSR